MFLVESIEIASNGVLARGTTTYNFPIVAAIRSPENFPSTWNALGTIYKIIPVNVNGTIQSCIAAERRIYLNLPSICNFGTDNFTLGILPVRWLYSKANTRLFLDIYA